jgi:Gpi18-like mannosyltransferase
MKFNKTYLYLLLLLLVVVLFRFLLTVITVNYLPSTRLDQNYETSQVRIIASKPSTLPTNEGVNLNLSNLWLRWDSSFYLSIIQNGYDKTAYKPGDFKNWVFFPLYPFTVKFVSNILGIQVTDTPHIGFLGIFLSVIFLYVSMVILWKLLHKLKVDDKTKWLSVAIILFTPGAHFLHLFYTESLFLLVSLCAFYFLFTKKYFLAFIFLALGLLARFNGILLYVPFIFYFITSRRVLTNIEKFRVSIYALLSVFPLLGFLYYLYTITVDFFIIGKVQQLTWNNQLAPFGYFTRFFETFGIGYVFYVLLLVYGFILMIYVWYKFKPLALNGLETIHQLKTLWVYGSTNLLFLASLQGNSIHRYLAVVFPLIVLPLFVLKECKYSNYILMGTLIVFSSLQVLFFTFFVLDAFVYSY